MPFRIAVVRRSLKAKSLVRIQEGQKLCINKNGEWSNGKTGAFEAFQFLVRVQALQRKSKA